MPKPVSVTLLSKPGCHLCDDARAVITRVLAECDARGISATLEEVDILGDARLARLHAEEIPVVLVNGRRHTIWHVDPDRFAAAVEKRAGARRSRNTPEPKE